MAHNRCWNIISICCERLILNTPVKSMFCITTCFSIRKLLDIWLILQLGCIVGTLYIQRRAEFVTWPRVFAILEQKHDACAFRSTIDPISNRMIFHGNMLGIAKHPPYNCCIMYFLNFLNAFNAFLSFFFKLIDTES